MEKHIAVIAIEENAVKNYAAQLQGFFGDTVIVDGYCISTELEHGKIEADLLAISAPDVTPYIEKYIPKDAHIIYIMRSFSKQKTMELERIEPGSKILLADYSENFANETLGVLNSIGYQNFNYLLHYPGKKGIDLQDLSCAIVTGDPTFVPKEIERIIDIGWYLISPTTLLEISQRLGLMDSRMGSKLYRYFKAVHVVDSGIFQVFKSFAQLESQWESVLNMVNGGVLLLDPNGNIIHYNDFIRRICKMKTNNSLTGRDVHQVLYDEVLKAIDRYDTLDNYLLDLPGGMKITISKRRITSYDDIRGDIILVEDASKIQRAEYDIRRQLAKRGLSAKYTFDQIIAESPAMKKCISQCRKIAGFDSAVLISGDSGVGKELLAQSIHNASQRRNLPFVAINCAALPAELLESELFGYEEGAFTGAKKGGKKGLLEMAHKGTIFLDEIGDMPMPVQAKLLRVLQEKEVMKIGSDYMLPVNIRIIAASNADFKELLAEKQFRKDLYYRLNAIHIYVPALSERREDVLALAEHFIKKYPGKYFSSELLELLPKLKWEGNVRQLEHCIEYMAIMGEELLMASDLPPGLSVEDNTDMTGFLGEEKELVLKILSILKIRNLGRRKLAQVLAEDGNPISEYQIRKLLDIMERKGMIKVNASKRGIELL